MITNPVSDNFQLPPNVQSGNSLPEKPVSLSLNSSKTKIPITSKLAAKSSPAITDNKVARDPATEKRIIEKFTQTIEPLSQNIQRKLNFQIDEITGSTVISVIDSQTNELIRQIPSEELLALSRRLKEVDENISAAKGVLISKDV